PGVLKVHEVYLLKPKLDHVVPLLKFPQAWDKIGGIDKAGAGMKIGMIDTGIDNWHLGFQDPNMTVPDGYPKVTQESYRSYTTTKIIVARTYDGFSPEDTVGHGTGTAMAAAGVMHLGARGNMSGTAPKAWLGSYRANDGQSFPSDNILRAIDDCVKD